MTDEEIQADRTQVREDLQKAFGAGTKVVGVILEIVTVPHELVFPRIQEAVSAYPGVVIDSLGKTTLIEGPIESMVELVSAGGALGNKEQFKRHPIVEYTLGLPNRPTIKSAADPIAAERAIARERFRNKPFEGEDGSPNAEDEEEMDPVGGTVLVQFADSTWDEGLVTRLNEHPGVTTNCLRGVGSICVTGPADTIAELVCTGGILHSDKYLIFTNDWVTLDLVPDKNENDPSSDK